ncbi:sugar phosphatase [Enterobacteriales bacterium SAP-6]|uniref:Sugar phosphatase n=1 Tax=Acerihabitans arboris TaxID=2691583 RepID=A0A845SK64_9GAMM|nr:sugar phosphatase [Acerihabitans arboris]NDL65300.1 sugar phosphatase [Acerihabitans arboris]
MLCKGFLFDLDGTLIDSLPVVELAWGNWARRRGVPVDDVYSFIHGKQAITSLRHFMPGESEECIQAEFTALEKFEAQCIDGVTALPGAVALLNRLNELDIPWAIVTSGSMPVASARLLAGRLPKPAVLVTAEQVARGKPQPDAYLLGAEKLGFAPQDCIVVEDAIAGIQAALAAGCPVIAVNPPPETPQKDAIGLLLTSLEQLLIEKDGARARVSLRTA